MGKLNNLGGNGELFVGEDKILEVEVLDRESLPVNITGWTVNCVISLTPLSAALYTLGSSVSGTYAADRATNTQRAFVTLTDTQLATLTKGKYVYSVKRTDDGAESILAWGNLHVQRANQT